MTSEEVPNKCTPLLGPCLAVLSLLAFCLHGAALASPSWLAKDFTVPAMPAPIARPPVQVESTVGLLWACTDQTVMAPGLDDKTDHKCETLTDVDTDLVEDWRWIGAGLGIGALVFSFMAFLVALVISRRLSRDICPRIGLVLLNLIACGLVVGTLVVFETNKNFELAPGSGMTIEYEISWGFLVNIVSCVVFFFMALFHIAALQCLPTKN